MSKKLRTLGEKQSIRYRMVYLAFGALIAIPLLALALLAIGISPAPASGIFATSAISLGAIVIGFFATAPTDDATEGFKNIAPVYQSDNTVAKRRFKKK